MTRLLTQHIATMTELREPHKVLGRANGQPVAILKSSEVVAYFIPAALAHPEWADPSHPGYGSFDALFDALNAETAASRRVGANPPTVGRSD